MLAMATPTAAPASPMYAGLDAPLTSSELREMEVGMHAASLGVRFYTRDVLALGRPYTVEYSLQSRVDEQPPASVQELPALGFDLISLFKSDLMQVKRVFPACRSDLSMCAESLHKAPMTTSDATLLDAMQPNDFLVGLNDDDLLLVPPGAYSRVRRRILRECNNALQQQQLNGDSPVLKLKFVRLDRVIQADPSRGLGYGAVLKKLEDLEGHHHALARQVDELISLDWKIVKERFAIPTKLLRHFCGWVGDTMEACMEEAGYQIADQTRAWIAAEWALNADDDDSDDDDEDVPMEEPEVFQVEENEVDEEESTQNKEQHQESHAGRAFPTAAPLMPVQKESTPAQALLTHEERLRAVGATNVDCRWRDVLQPHEMKWLTSSHAVLTKFIEGLVDGFVSDGVWAPEMAVRSRTIVETLVVAYARKLRTTSTDNATVKKEFLHHARMLRSNIANAGNKQLRADVLAGAVPVATLCEMTSAELAPEPLQAERQRRQEQHTKEITLSKPTGPCLVKTKHGFKEIGPVVPTVLDGETASQPSVQEVHPVQAGTVLPAEAEREEVTTRETKLTDEVIERLGAMEVEQPAGSDRKLDQLAPPQPPLQPTEPQPANYRTAQAATPLHNRQPAPRPVATVDTARYSTEDGRIFLRTLFDPAQEPVVETLRRLQYAINSTDILATMNNEMKVGGILMYRDLKPVQTHYGLQQRARVRLLCWTVEKFSPSGRDASTGALSGLIGEIEECYRLFGGVLDDLRYNLHFPQPLHEERVYRRAIDYLVGQGMKLPCYREGSSVFFVEAKLDSLILAVGRDYNEPAARDRAAHDAAAYLSDLVALRAFRPAPTARESRRDQHWGRIERPRESNYSHADYRHAGNGIQNGVGGNYNAPQGRDHPLHESLDRKRPFTHDQSTEYPPAVRRRVEDERGLVDRQEPTTTDSAPLFFADAKGEVKPRDFDPSAKENAQKMQVDGYQELVRALVKNFSDVKARLNFDWDPRVPEKTITFSSRLSVIRKITRHPSTRLFRCEISGFDGNLHKTRERENPEHASKDVVVYLEDWLRGIRGMWLQLADIYANIMVRKRKQRGNQADDSLSAAHETRKDRAVSKFVVDKEKSGGHHSEYAILVHGLVAVRQVCLNQKMAKRAAGEVFRDLLIWINKTLDETRSAQQRGPNPTSSQNNSISGPTARAPAAKSRSHTAGMVVCSDDSDDDDDDDDHFGGGGVYSDDEDWRPQPKQPNEGGGSHTRDPSPDKNSRFRVEALLSEEYPVESEAGSGDDARLRAVLRSLFTPDDDLCKEINGIRGALKYRGKFDKLVVPNVTASIRLDLLRGDMFDVYASVNDVVHFKGTATSKQEACERAVNGLLEELERMRRMWVQMVHFYHEKEMGSNNPIQTFHLLRHANIAPIETRTEAPPASSHNRMLEAKMATDVHCVMYVGDKVVYRVNDYVEEDAHAIATCRSIQFIVDLIDQGLDPMPVDIQDNDFRVMSRADWSCKVILQDVGNSNAPEEEFHADACWAIPNRVPSETSDFRTPRQTTIRQVNRILIREFEDRFSSSNARQHAFFFRIEATYENGKFVNHLAEYGNKNKHRAYVVELKVDGDPDVAIFILPPGASVNSQANLYWSRKIMPPELNHRKAVYGFAIRRHFAPIIAPRW